MSLFVFVLLLLSCVKSQFCNHDEELTNDKERCDGAWPYRCSDDRERDCRPEQSFDCPNGTCIDRCDEVLACSESIEWLCAGDMDIACTGSDDTICGDMLCDYVNDPECEQICWPYADYSCSGEANEGCVIDDDDSSQCEYDR
eukprot:UN17943